MAPPPLCATEDTPPPSPGDEEASAPGQGASGDQRLSGLTILERRQLSATGKKCGVGANAPGASSKAVQFPRNGQRFFHPAEGTTGEAEARRESSSSACVPVPLQRPLSPAFEVWRGGPYHANPEFASGSDGSDEGGMRDPPPPRGGGGGAGGREVSHHDFGGMEAGRRFHGRMCRAFSSVSAETYFKT